ncbi:MAG: gephyrin-like molybdotransferase Glp [Paracoccaceae bacterium]
MTPKLANDCFAMPPGVRWTPVDEALARLRETMHPVVGSESLPLDACGGRVLAQPVTARRAHPPYANSAVDGYGFAHAALSGDEIRLPLAAGRAAAGEPFDGAVPAGSAVRILTGAMLPPGVDTVVMQEDVAVDAGHVRFGTGLKPGANCRLLGEDVAEGQTILHAGRRLTPGDIALLAATGSAGAEVFRRLRVGVLSTGDEVRPAGAPIAPHEIYDANRPMLIELLRRWDMEPVDLGHARDTKAAVAAALDAGAARADAIVTSGGASAGDEDHVSATLQEAGTLATWRIAIKPGRPLALGLWNRTPVFGLPGNPVAALVCTLVFGRPALLAMAGAGWRTPGAMVVPAAFRKAKKGGRREYLRARLNADGAAEVFPSEGSGRISGLSWARGLVELGDDAADIAEGTPVRFLPFAEFGY